MLINAFAADETSGDGTNGGLTEPADEAATTIDAAAPTASSEDWLASEGDGPWLSVAGAAEYLDLSPTEAVPVLSLLPRRQIDGSDRYSANELDDLLEVVVEADPIGAGRSDQLPDEPGNSKPVEGQPLGRLGRNEVIVMGCLLERPHPLTRKQIRERTGLRKQATKDALRQLENLGHAARTGAGRSFSIVDGQIELDVLRLAVEGRHIRRQ